MQSTIVWINNELNDKGFHLIVASFLSWLKATLKHRSRAAQSRMTDAVNNI